MSYTHLTREERYQIRAMLDAHCTIRRIAGVLGRCSGPISRELSRNRWLRGYWSAQADRPASERAVGGQCRCRITTREWTEISRLIRLDWSPEQGSTGRHIQLLAGVDLVSSSTLTKWRATISGATCGASVSGASATAVGVIGKATFPTGWALRFDQRTSIRARPSATGKATRSSAKVIAAPS